MNEQVSRVIFDFLIDLTRVPAIAQVKGWTTNIVSGLSKEGLQRLIEKFTPTDQDKDILMGVRTFSNILCTENRACYELRLSDFDSRMAIDVLRGVAVECGSVFKPAFSPNYAAVCAAAERFARAYEAAGCDVPSTWRSPEDLLGIALKNSVRRAQEEE